MLVGLLALLIFIYKTFIEISKERVKNNESYYLLEESANQPDVIDKLID